MKINFSQSFSLIIAGLLIWLFSGSCQKDELLDDPVNLQFSSDTILFDTLFTTIGSSTQSFRVYNPKDEDVEIDQIMLAGGQSSPFRINVNGLSGTSFSNIKLRGNDSLYTYVEVTVDPNDNEQPMIITDSIVFNTNGKVQDIKLVAWGQDANFIVADTDVSGLPAYKIVAHQNENIVWDSNKPYVIYGYAVVDSTASLTITEGTDVHFHANSGLWVYKGGNLKVEGTPSDPVHFRGDRPEPYYEDIPGQWDRIWLNEGSVDNEIRHAIIENGFIGIQAETLEGQMGNQLITENVIIRNMTGMGFLGRNYKVSTENTEVSNCGNYAVALTNGGDYSFTHLTVGNYWSDGIRQTPSLYLNNFFEQADGSLSSNDLSVTIANSIIYGNQQNEFLTEDIDDGSLLEFTIDHCLVKTTQATTGNSWVNSLINQNPQFEDAGNDDYTLSQGSPAIDAGTPAYQVPFDLKGDPRDAQPDMGAYEYVP
ncbi:MAG: choice-of-anchor Q domain-containing protein [Bacteroidales bacterium]